MPYPVVAQLLLPARCNIDVQTNCGLTALQAAQRAGHLAIATMIRNAQQKGAKDVLLQASSEKIKKQQEDADRAMRELLEEEEKEKAAAAAGSQKQKQANAGKSEKKKKTEKVAAVAVVAGLKDKVELEEEEEENKEKPAAAAGSQKKKQSKKARKEQSGEALTVKQLLDAARDGDAAKVSSLLSTQGAQSLINYQDAQGATPLFIAAQKGHASVTEQLIAARCNVDIQDEMRYTPLHIAAGSGLASVAKQLLAARCNIDGDGGRPHCAAIGQATLRSTPE